MGGWVGGWIDLYPAKAMRGWIGGWVDMDVPSSHKEDLAGACGLLGDGLVLGEAPGDYTGAA